MTTIWEAAKRFREQENPVRAVVRYLSYLHDEATHRGYRFDATRLDCEPDPDLQLTVSRLQLEFELEHLRRKVHERAPEWEARLGEPLAHPLFRVVAGPVASWERG